MEKIDPGQLAMPMAYDSNQRDNCTYHNIAGGLTIRAELAARMMPECIRQVIDAKRREAKADRDRCDPSYHRDEHAELSLLHEMSPDKLMEEWDYEGDIGIVHSAATLAVKAADALIAELNS